MQLKLLTCLLVIIMHIIHFPSRSICYYYKPHPNISKESHSSYLIPKEYSNFIEDDSIVIPPFTIQVKLSHKAYETIIESGESIFVNFSISFVEDDFVANSLYRKQVAEDGKIWFYDKSKEIELSSLSVVFDNIKIPRKLYYDLVDKEIYGFGYCITGGKKFKTNLLNPIDFVDCDILNIKSGDIFTITGKLIGERD